MRKSNAQHLPVGEVGVTPAQVVRRQHISLAAPRAPGPVWRAPVSSPPVCRPRPRGVVVQALRGQVRQPTPLPLKAHHGRGSANSCRFIVKTHPAAFWGSCPPSEFSTAQETLRAPPPKKNRPDVFRAQPCEFVQTRTGFCPELSKRIAIKICLI